MKHYKYDYDFLKQLDKNKNKIIYARVIALDINELPLQQIEGYVTQGNINLDGASAVRRTCSLTIVAREDKFQISKYDWTFNTKFKLEIGVENLINKNYPKIIWFPQGIYIVTSFSTSRSTNNLTITLQGKDKMCLLNGEIGGNVESVVDFGKIIEADNVTRKIPIIEIIQNMLVHYGRERIENIIINDLDDYGLELLEYRGSSPLYLFRRGEDNTDTFLTATYQGDTLCEIRDPAFKETDETVNTKFVLLKNLNNNEWNTTYDSLSNGLLGKSKNIANVIGLSGEESNINNPYHVVKIDYGQTVGFRTTDLVYAGDLIANIGETLTSVLDKIKNMLGDFEYFYDIDGRFIFQQKPSVYRRSWATSYEIVNGEAIINEEQENKFLEKLEQSKSSTYNLDGTELITAFNNTPTINNIKNDFSIWGQRTSATGGNVSIHLRCAIDNKPISYRTILLNDEKASKQIQDYNTKYKTKLVQQTSVHFIAGSETKIMYDDSLNEWQVICDWREIIYRMADDYLKYGFMEDFKFRIAQANENENLYQNGLTGYEQYYTDIQGNWRDIYNPNYYIYQDITLYEYITGKNYSETNEYKLHPNKEYYIPQEKKENNININILEANPQFSYWSKSVVEAPETINFWFDLIDTTGELSKYSVEAIGRRTKVINDTNIKAIFYEDTPTVIFVDDIKKYQAVSSGDYSYIQIPKALELFSISARGQSAMDKLDSLLYQHTYCAENASITTLPIYHLQPNTRIHIEDSVLGVNGDYIASKFSIQLSHGGTMTITATKAIDQISYY